jgi:quercetin 2,3-dioxygenase
MKYELTLGLLCRHFSDEEKKDAWVNVVAPSTDKSISLSREASGPAPVHSPLALFATLLSTGKSLTHTNVRSKAYLHVVQTSGYNTGAATGATVQVTVGGGEKTVLREGDGVYVHLPPGTEIQVENTGDRTAEVMLFDLE